MTSVISTICVVCIATPPFVVCLIPIGLFYLSQQRYFSKTYREIKRIDSVARSPVYALFSETLDELTTVRAYSASNFLKRRIITLLDDQQIAYFLIFSSQCWLAVRLELAGTIIHLLVWHLYSNSVSKEVVKTLLVLQALMYLSRYQVRNLCH